MDIENPDPVPGLSRRAAVTRLTLGAGAVWAAPVVVGLDRAFAGQTGSPAPAEQVAPEFEDGGDTLLASGQVVVPAGAKDVLFVLTGAAGGGDGSGNSNSQPGRGGEVTFTVPPAEVERRFDVVLGTQGARQDGGSAGGGGGRSTVSQGGVLLAVAGGGGGVGADGSGPSNKGGRGGDAGAPAGGAGRAGGGSSPALPLLGGQGGAGGTDPGAGTSAPTTPGLGAAGGGGGGGGATGGAGGVEVQGKKASVVGGGGGGGGASLVPAGGSFAVAPSVGPGRLVVTFKRPKVA